MDVADDVERPELGSLVGPHRRARELDGRDVLLGLQDERAPEALALQVPQRALELRALAPDHVRAEVPVRAAGVARRADLARQVEHDGDREQVVLADDLHQRLARLALDVGGVDDGQPPTAQPPAGDLVQDGERVLARALVVRVVGHQAATEVRGDHLGAEEVLRGERALARAGRADQHHEAGIREVDLHRSNTAICVGGPTTASSGRSAGSGRSSRARRRHAKPRPRTPRGSIRSDGPRGAARPPAASPTSGCTPRSASSRPHSAAGPSRRRWPRRPQAAAGRSARRPRPARRRRSPASACRGRSAGCAGARPAGPGGGPAAAAARPARAPAPRRRRR